MAFEKNFDAYDEIEDGDHDKVALVSSDGSLGVAVISAQWDDPRLDEAVQKIREALKDMNA